MRKYNNVILILFFICVILFVIMLCIIAGIKDNRSNADEVSAETGFSDEKKSYKNASDKEQKYNSGLLPGDGCDDDFIIMLDAGHGGKDEGTHFGDVYEKDIAMSVVNYMNEMLEDEGIHVILTRRDDTFMKLKKRTDIANNEGADLFVSIHCNYYEYDSQIRGFECYYMEGRCDSMEYADSIVDYLEQAGRYTIRGVREEDFFVLRNTISPAVLIELGYLSNKDERKKLADDDYQKQLAEDIVRGIMQCKHNQNVLF